MNDQSFRELELLALVCPSQPNWPTDTVHGQLLSHAAVETRSRLAKFLATIDEIDSDPRLTPEAKRDERAKAATKALASLDGSSVLRRAQDSATEQLARWNAMVAKSIKVAEDANAVAVATQIRNRVASLKDSERMKWISKHGDDPVIISALLTAPQGLSGLSDAEWALVKSRAEAKALSPEIIEAKSSTTRALADLQRGSRAAQAKIVAVGGFALAPPPHPVEKIPTLKVPERTPNWQPQKTTPPMPAPNWQPEQEETQ